jgi:uncharacterized phage protein (TIGR01671 family)
MKQTREIKFRAWDKKDKEFVEWWEFSISEEEIYIHDWCVNWGRDRFELLQYTWLKDKNWKEIYEWDIVNAWSAWSNAICEVKRSKGTVSFFLYRYPDVCWHISWEDWKEIFEIIWNIYENSDLLPTKD